MHLETIIFFKESKTKPNKNKTVELKISKQANRKLTTVAILHIIFKIVETMLSDTYQTHELRHHLQGIQIINEE